MAVPTITSIAPADGIADGGEFVSIEGTGFAAAVEITLGGVVAEQIGVATDGGVSRADVWTPTGPQTPGPVDVVLQNLDGDGEAVPGELATVAGGFTYARRDTTGQSDLARIVEALILCIRRAVLENAAPGASIDYSAQPADDARLIEVVDLPSVTVTGPSMPTNTVLRRMDRRLDAIPGAPHEVTIRGPSQTVDLVFGVNIQTRNSVVQLMNIVAALAAWLHERPWLHMLEDAGDPASAMLRWPVDGGDVRMSSGGPDNVRAASMGVVIHGFNLSEGALIDWGRTVDEVEVTAQPFGDC